MPTTTFLRLLAADDKAAALRAATDALHNGTPAPDVYTVDPAFFRQVPGSPFAYWVSESVLSVFKTLPALGSHGRSVHHGLSTKDDPRFLRLLWECPSTGGSAHQVTWTPFAKGGAYSPYYYALHLAVRSDDNMRAIKESLIAKYPYLVQRSDQTVDEATAWVIHPENPYFRPGLTYPSRTTSNFSVRVMPAGCIFASKGPAMSISGDSDAELLALLAVVNSRPFGELLKLQLGAADAAARSYEVGLIQEMPIPTLIKADQQMLVGLAREAHNLKRDADRDDEVTHPFTIPALVRLRERPGLSAAIEALRTEDDGRERRLDAIQREIDDRCFVLYGFSAEDRAQIEGAGAGLATISAEAAESGDETAPARDTDDEGDGNDETSAKNSKQSNGEQQLRIETVNLLMYAIGCTFGRWDVRIGRDPSLAPKLADPFAPLPVCAPGTLVGPDGLPATREQIVSEAWLRARPDVITLPEPSQFEDAAHTTTGAEAYPVPVAWDGILVDDASAPDDIVRRVRAVLDYLWGERADAIESEACAILGVRELRDYFRNPRLFFDFHIGRYSKSRRKAPIYWLLQSPKRNYAIWLYYQRLDADLIFKAINFHLLPKFRLEEQRLEELEAARTAAGTTGAEARRAAQAVDRQEALLADLREFHAALDRAARLYLTPDLNDGVILNIAPYWEVVPWKEAKASWGQLGSGKYGWSSIGKQLQEKGLLRRV